MRDIYLKWVAGGSARYAPKIRLVPRRTFASILSLRRGGTRYTPEDTGIMPDFVYLIRNESISVARRVMRVAPRRYASEDTKDYIIMNSAF